MSQFIAIERSGGGLFKTWRIAGDLGELAFFADEYVPDGAKPCRLI
ncbi:hypothetical protein ACEWPJ_13215 [Aliiroseovarius sp. YM-037]